MSMRLNWKLLAWVGGGAAMLATAVHLLHGFESGRGARQLLPLVGAAEERGDTAGAAHFLGDYLALAPDDLDAQIRYGDLLPRLPGPAARGRALAVYEQVLRRQPGRAEVRRGLVRLALELDRLGDAQAHLAVLMRAAPDDAALEVALGRCQEADKDYAHASRTFARSIQHDPHQVDAYVRLARLLRLRLGRPEEADQVIDSLVEANGESFRAYLGRGRYCQEFGPLDAAARDLARAQELAPREPDVLLAVAELAQARGDLDGARRQLEQCRELAPRTLRLFQDLGGLEAEAGWRRQAIAYLTQGLTVFPDQPDLLLALVELLLEENDQAGSGAIISRLQQLGSSAEQVEYLHARQLILQGRWAEAVRLLEWVRGRAPASDLLNRVELFLGLCYEQLDDPEQELTTYRRAVERGPVSPTLHLALGATLAAQDRTDEAVAEYWQAMGMPKAPPAGWTMLARALVERTLRLPPATRNWAETERVLARADKALPGSAEVALLRADVLAAQGEYERAKQVLTEGLSGSPERAAALADLAGAQGQWDEALRTLDEARKKFGDVVELRLARARTWARRGTAEAPARLAEAAHDRGELSAADEERLLRGLADVYATAGDARSATRFRALVAERRPDELRTRLFLFDAAARAEDEAAMKRWLEEIRRIEGKDGPHSCYGEAVRALQKAQRGDRSGLAEARRLLEAAAARRRTWPRVPLLAAQIDELEGKPRQAAANYVRAVELGDREPDVIRHAARLLSEQGRPAEARRLLGRLPQ
jgi:tetratricopeptide (TPR) repeat protein